MEKLIKDFYEGLKNKDLTQIANCYHPEASFTDPAFGTLKANEVLHMWKMLLRPESDITLTYKVLQADAQKGLGQWDAHYTFPSTGRKVHNHILSKFQFKDGLIYIQEDTFNLHTWAKQAIGPMGFILGGTRFFKEKFQKQAKEKLKAFMSKS